MPFFYIFLLLIDRLLKYFAINNYFNNFGIKNILFLTFEKNYYSSFGIKIDNDLIIIFSIILFIILYVYIYKRDKDISLYLILIGTISNIFDRIINGYVVDYINFLNINVFNFSDILIFVGFVILIKNKLYDK